MIDLDESVRKNEKKYSKLGCNNFLSEYAPLVEVATKLICFSLA